MSLIYDIMMLIFTLFKIHVFVFSIIVLAIIIFVKRNVLKVKLLIFTILLLISSIFIFIPGDISIYEKVKEFRLIIVDEYTRKGIPNLPIYFCVEKGQLLTTLCTTSYPIIVKKYTSDSNGMCVIPQHSYWKMPKIQWTQSVIIAVNIEVVEKVKKEEGEDAKGFWSYFDIHEINNYNYYYNANNNYYGAVIYLRKNGYMDLEGNHKVKYKRYDLIFEDIDYPHNIYIIRLKRK